MVSRNKTSNVQLVGQGQPSITLSPTFDVANSRKRHVMSDCEHVVGSNHIEDALAGIGGAFAIIIHGCMPMRLLQRQGKVVGHIAPDQ